MADHERGLLELKEVSIAIQYLLGPYTPEQRSAVLADLLSLLLAGYQGIDAPKRREEILQHHVRLVRDLIGVQEKLVLYRATVSGNG